MAERKRRHRWGERNSVDGNFGSPCLECGVRLEWRGIVRVFLYPDGRLIVDTKRQPPCPGPSQKEKNQ